jgi:hypothetical protein
MHALTGREFKASPWEERIRQKLMQPPSFFGLASIIYENSVVSEAISH